MRKVVLAAAMAAFTMSGMAAAPAFAAGGGGDDMSVSIGDVKRYVERKQYSSAINKANEYLRDNPRSADAYNYIGYSRRQMGEYDRAKSAYDRALKINPNHVGAHEYYGELHIKMGNMAAAEKHLADLTRICGNCEEQQMLAGKIARAKAGG